MSAKASHSYALEKFFAACLIAATVAGGVLWASGEGFFQRAEWLLQDRRMAFYRADAPVDPSIAVVLVDEASLRAMNRLVGRWPWPRSVHADAVDFISLGKPKAIVFDVLFTEDDRSGGKDGDARIAEASAMAGNVFHAMQLLVDIPDEKNKGLLNLPMPSQFVDSFGLKGDIDPFVINSYRSIGLNQPNNFYVPIPLVATSALGVGVVDFDPDRDGVFRSTSLMRAYQDALFPVLSIAPLLAGEKSAKLDREGLKVGDYSIPLDETGRYLVKLCGKYNEYSMSGVLASAQMLMRGEAENLIIDPGEFKDKIVFIGGSAVGVEDLKSTPLDPKTPGVFLHASILTNVLNRDFLHYAPEWLGVVAVLLFSAICVGVVMYIPHMSAQVGVPLLLWLGYTYAAFAAFGHNMVWPLAVPSAAIWFSSIFAFVFYGITEGRARRKVRKMFSLYVSPEVLNEVVENFGDQEDVAKGTEETITILFSDIRSFTNISEKLSAPRVVEMLNTYFTEMIEAIFKYGGTVDKFIGDAIMCFWGAPIRKPDHEKAGVLCALEMIERLEKVNEDLVRRGFEPIAIGVGLNTGHVVLGNIGSEKKINYTVIGDSVNLASRLEGITKTYGAKIIISEFTYEGLKGQIPCAVVDVVKVKGKLEPIRLYRPLVSSSPTEEELLAARALSLKVEEAFAHYLARRWDEAIELYSTLPQEKSIVEMILRCEEYKVEPPPGEWDGVVTMKTK